MTHDPLAPIGVIAHYNLLERIDAAGDRPLPEVFASRYGSIEIGNRGGILVHGTTPTIPWTK